MGSIDATTWTALGLSLTVLGLVISWVVWRRRGAAAGTRAVAWSLLPLAAGLTGVLRLVANVADEVASWALRLVFSPVVWTGIVLTGVSVVLFGVSAVMNRRGGGAPTSGKAPDRKAVGRSAPPAARTDDVGLDDDIEAILKKHGIS